MSAKHFLAALQKTVKKIGVHDQMKEAGSFCGPLTSTLLLDAQVQVVCIGGRWGLGSKGFTLALAKAVFDNVLQEKPRNHFTVGINDGVMLLSLPVGQDFSPIPMARRSECSGVFARTGRSVRTTTRYGSSHKHGPMLQGYFSYDTTRRGVTRSATSASASRGSRRSTCS